MLKLKKNIKNSSIGKTFLITLGACALSTIIISLVMALIANCSQDPTSLIDIFSLIALLISGAISGFLTIKIKKDSLPLYIIAMGISLVAIMLVIGIITGGGKIGVSALMNYLCYLGIFLLSSLLTKRSGHIVRHRRVFGKR